MYRLNFSFVGKYLPMLVSGVKLSLVIIVGSMLIGIILGTVFALFRQSKNRLLRAVSSVWVNALRNTPFLVQLFFFYYGLPLMGIDTSPVATSIIALGINTSAVNCEIIRAGLLAVKTDYYECAKALGFNRFQTIRLIVLPIALRVAFKPLTNNFVNLALTSSTAFSITCMEIMGVAKTVSSNTSRPFEVYILIILLYCIFTYTISFAAKLIDRRIAIKL